jgi:hypothetical protein
MLKARGTWIGAAAAVVAGVLLVAGMAVSTQSGAATDLNVGGAPQGQFEVPAGNPPAAPVEPPANPGNDGTGIPGVNPTGANAGAGAAPNGLPNAGAGQATGNSATSMMVLLGLAGVLLAGAGASVVAAKRSK